MSLSTSACRRTEGIRAARCFKPLAHRFARSAPSGGLLIKTPSLRIHERRKQLAIGLIGVRISVSCRVACGARYALRSLLPARRSVGVQAALGSAGRHPRRQCARREEGGAQRTSDFLHGDRAPKDGPPRLRRARSQGGSAAPGLCQFAPRLMICRDLTGKGYRRPPLPSLTRVKGAWAPSRSSPPRPCRCHGWKPSPRQTFARRGRAIPVPTADRENASPRMCRAVNHRPGRPQNPRARCIPV